MKEEEIRPQQIFAEYLRLCEQDIKTFFADAAREKGDCPACGLSGEFTFTKQGFDYELCPHCLTLFANPRPVAEAFSRYYTESLSSKFWATTFYKETAGARREKLWKPKAQLIRDALCHYDAFNHAVVDIGGGFGIFAEEMERLTERPVVIIEPGPHLARVCRERGLEVIQKFVEQVGEGDLPSGPKAFVSFELFEHLHNPSQFLSCLEGLMHSGDLFLFTTLSGTGVDIQVLWEDSKSVSPPHHLNFFNPRSVKICLGNKGFEVLEVTTPGKLDIDILLNNRAKIKDGFWRTFVSHATESMKERWQDLVATTGWSSHMMVCARKY